MTGRALLQAAQSRTAAAEGLPLSFATKAALFIAAHAALGLAAKLIGSVAWAHMALTSIVALLAAAFGARSATVVAALAYVVSAEVLWRMTDAGGYWEQGKYLVVAASGIALLRTRGVRWLSLPVLFLVLMIPAVVMVATEGGAQAADQLSFNLSGPVALGLCALAFMHTKLSVEDLKRVLLACAGPVAAIAAITAYSIVTAHKLEFGDDSNFVTSGGFGPNQVSSALGFASLACFLLTLSPRLGRTSGLLAMGLSLAFLVQGILTFSRGGVFASVIAAIAAAVVLVTDAASRWRVFVFLLAGGVVARWFILPWLEEMTEGMVVVRFTSSDLTGRGLILNEDLRIFLEHPWFGVGLGNAAFHRSGAFVAAHTEFTRLLAEQGLFGLFALCSLVLLSMKAYLSCHGRYGRAVVTALITWTFLLISSSGMRVAMPAFAFGLALAVAAQRGGASNPSSP